MSEGHVLRAARDAVADAQRGTAARNPVVTVVGDVMLDRYLDGASHRLSPEAPVPVVALDATTERAGGAANVAAGLATLGLDVRLVGVVGADLAGGRLRGLIESLPGCQGLLIEDSTRPSTTKDRVRVAGRHLVRLDHESTDPLDTAIATEVRTACEQAIDGASVLVISDYAKGVVSPALVRALVDTDAPSLVDPKHADIERYAGASFVAPNLSEARLVCGDERQGPPEPGELDDLIGALEKRLPGTTVLVTLGPQGIAWREADGEVLVYPTLARTAADVTGSGDSVMVGLAIGMALDLPTTASVALGAAVAAVAVETAGTTTPTWTQLVELVSP